MYNLESVLENKMQKLLWDFKIQTHHIILARRPDLVIVNKTSEPAGRIINFTVSGDHRAKLKAKIEISSWTFARELKKHWNNKVTVISIVIGALGTITKGLLQGKEDLQIRRRVETIQTTALLRSARILRRILETLGDLQSLKLQ